MTTRGKLVASYSGNEEPASKFTDYFPEWLNQLAEDVTLESSLLNGVVQGREAVHFIVVAIRSFYDRQEWYFAGKITDNCFLEDYISTVKREPLGCIVLAFNNGKGELTHISAGYRPRNTLLVLTSLLAEKFAGTPIARFFTTARV